MSPTIHQLLQVTLLIPLVALTIGVIAASFGIAWFARTPKGRR